MLYQSGKYSQLSGSDVYGCHSPSIGSFNNVKFAKSAPKPLNLQDAVAFAAKEGGILPSLQEEALLRIAQGGVVSKEPGLTRTIALYFLEGGLPWVSFDDYPGFKENIASAYADKMSRQQMRTTEFYLPKSDPLVSAAIRRAGDKGRAIWGLSPTGKLEFNFAQDSERTRFAESPFAKAVYGGVAMEVANGIYHRRRSPHTPHQLTVTMLCPADLRLPNDSVDVRLVYLGDILGQTVDINATGRSRMLGVATPVLDPKWFYK